MVMSVGHILASIGVSKGSIKSDLFPGYENI